MDFVDLIVIIEDNGVTHFRRDTLHSGFCNVHIREDNHEFRFGNFCK